MNEFVFSIAFQLHSDKILLEPISEDTEHINYALFYCGYKEGYINARKYFTLDGGIDFESTKDSVINEIHKVLRGKIKDGNSYDTSSK